MNQNRKIALFLLIAAATGIIVFTYLSMNNSFVNGNNSSQSNFNNPYGLNGKVYFFARKGSATVIFPNDPRIKAISGTIIFLNLATKDSFKLQVEVPNGKKSVLIESPKIIQSQWQLKFSWISDNKIYLSQHKIEIK